MFVLIGVGAPALPVAAAQPAGLIVKYVGLAREPNRRAKTLGFAVAKGLIRGLTRCPNPSLLILTCYPFLDVSYGVLTVPCCRYASM